MNTRMKLWHQSRHFKRQDSKPTFSDFRFPSALWCSTTKNPDLNIELLACLFAYSLTHFLICTPLCSLSCSLTHSFTSRLVGKGFLSMIGMPGFYIVLTHSALELTTYSDFQRETVDGGGS